MVQVVLWNILIGIDKGGGQLDDDVLQKVARTSHLLFVISCNQIFSPNCTIILLLGKKHSTEEDHSCVCIHSIKSPLDDCDICIRFKPNTCNTLIVTHIVSNARLI